MIWSDPYPSVGSWIMYYPTANEFPNATESSYPALVIKFLGADDPNTMRRKIDNLLVFTEVGNFMKTNVIQYQAGEPIPPGSCAFRNEDALREYRYPIS